jgi:hypothetical protein
MVDDDDDDGDGDDNGDGEYSRCFQDDIYVNINCNILSSKRMKIKNNKN